MNKPLAFLCSCIAGVGVLILAHCFYLTVVYGRGDPEAGNFHRSFYSIERDIKTGEMRRKWDTNWEMVSSTEAPIWAGLLDMWWIGVAFVVLGAGIYGAEWSKQGRDHF